MVCFYGKCTEQKYTVNSVCVRARVRVRRQCNCRSDKLDPNPSLAQTKHDFSGVKMKPHRFVPTKILHITYTCNLTHYYVSFPCCELHFAR